MKVYTLSWVDYNELGEIVWVSSEQVNYVSFNRDDIEEEKRKLSYDFHKKGLVPMNMDYNGIMNNDYLLVRYGQDKTYTRVFKITEHELKM